MIKIDKIRNKLKIETDMTVSTYDIDTGYLFYGGFVDNIKQIIEIIELFEQDETIISWVDGKIERCRG